MFGAIKSLFGASKTSEKIVDGAISGLDAMFFTKEEKSRAGLKVLDFQLAYAKATSGQNLARRLIAVMITGLFCFLVLFGVGVWWINTEYSQFIFDTVKDLVLKPFMIILGFYFLTATVRSVIGGKK